jgi:hypothetical protein
MSPVVDGSRRIPNPNGGARYISASNLGCQEVYANADAVRPAKALNALRCCNLPCLNGSAEIPLYDIRGFPYPTRPERSIPSVPFN